MATSSYYAKGTVRADLEGAAKKIEKHDPRSANRLLELADAVGGGSYSDAWAASDIYSMVNIPVIVNRYRNQPKKEGPVAVAELVRNILIFAPLIVTWFGISSAASAYSDLVQQEPDKSNLPFVLLWQQGFYGRLSGLQSFSSVATIDFVILSLVLLLTAFVSYYASVTQRKREQEALNLEDELNHALTGARLNLTTKSWTEPTNFVSRFDKLIVDFRTTVGELVQQIKEERIEIAKLADRQSQETRLFDAFKVDLRNSMNGVASSAAQMSGTTTTLNQTISTLQTTTSQLTSPIAALATQQDLLVKNFEDSLDLLRQQVKSQDASVHAQEHWGEELRVSMETLQQAVKQSSTQENELTRTVTDLQDGYRNYLDLMKDEHESQRQITNRVYEAADKLGQTVDLLERWHTELNSINVQMDDLVRQYGALAPSKP
ncbi:hypothetical protein ccbrp13_04460 [Ktedonobacteria bacterium brp13]|nr:hypothetical protein ccbrp13_04460 [Ktedonobacteria bacterium brp13]